MKPNCHNSLSPCGRVIAIQELLDMIVAFVGVGPMIRNRRVCQYWSGYGLYFLPAISLAFISTIALFLIEAFYP
jgi:hypothetical protein